MCNARPCQERRARAQAAQALNTPQVAKVTPKVSVKPQARSVVRNPITRIAPKRGK